MGRLRSEGSDSPARYGAYGLTPVTDLSLPIDRLVPAPPDWIDWSFEWRSDVAAAIRMDELDDYYISDISARMPVMPLGYVEVDRNEATSRFTLDHDLTAEGLVHPGLAPTAALVARWQGRIALHGAAVAKNSLAVGIVADREHGKSSTVARLLQRGWTLVADDVLVIDGTNVLAGPPIVDLRFSTASQWDLGTNVGVLGQRERWRVTSTPGAPVTPLVALVCLEWADAGAVEKMTTPQKFVTIGQHNVLQVPPLGQRAAFDLLKVPFARFSRPKNLDDIDRHLDLLLSWLGGLEPGLLE